MKTICYLRVSSPKRNGRSRQKTDSEKLVAKLIDANKHFGTIAGPVSSCNHLLPGYEFCFPARMIYEFPCAHEPGLVTWIGDAFGQPGGQTQMAVHLPQQ